MRTKTEGEMRIADFLKQEEQYYENGEEDEDEDVEEEEEEERWRKKHRRRSIFSRWISSSCSSSKRHSKSVSRERSSSWRWLVGGSPSRSERRRGEERTPGAPLSFDESLLRSCPVRDDEEEEENEEEELKETSSSLAISGESQCRSQFDAETVGFSSGKNTTDASFNLGLGAGVCFLMAACRNEFNKMMELQTQMEFLIKETNNQMPIKDVISKHFESNEDVGSSTTSPGIRNTRYHPIVQSCELSRNMVEAEDTMECDSHLKCDASMKEDCFAGIHQLEAELEAELEYLQFRLDAEATSEHAHQQKTQPIAESADSHGSCVDHEEDDPQEADCLENCGVSPDELERRLHELLEERQQERIEELECALESTKQKLYLKEMEVSWWKDIADLISPHVHIPPIFKGKHQTVESYSWSE